MRWIVAITVLLTWAVAARAAAQAPAPAGPVSALDRRVSLDVTDADVRDALRHLFDQARADYVVAPEVAGRVTATLTDRPLRMALDMVLRSVASHRALTYRVEDGVVHVGLRPEPAPEAPREPDRPEPRRTSAMERIELRNVDAVTMAERLEMAGIAQVLYLPGMPSLQSGRVGGGQIPSLGGTAIIRFPGMGGSTGYGVFERRRSGGFPGLGGLRTGGLSLGVLR